MQPLFLVFDLETCATSKKIVNWLQIFKGKSLINKSALLKDRRFESNYFQFERCLFFMLQMFRCNIYYLQWTRVLRLNMPGRPR